MLVLLKALWYGPMLQAAAVTAVVLEIRLISDVAIRAAPWIANSSKTLARLHGSRQRITNPLKGKDASGWHYRSRVDKIVRKAMPTDQASGDAAAHLQGATNYTALLLLFTGVLLLLVAGARMLHARRCRLVSWAALKLQCAARALQPRVLCNLRRAAVLTVQSYARGRAEVRRLAATRIQREARRVRAQRLLASARGAAICIYWLAGAASTPVFWSAGNWAQGFAAVASP